LPSDPNLRFRPLESERCAAIIRGGTIRSVSHLVLALDEPMSGSTTFEPKGADRMAPALAPSGSVFFGQSFFDHTTLVLSSARVHPLLRPSRQRRDQKTFSAGPCSFRTKELWPVASWENDTQRSDQILIRCLTAK
jgi:hypothetical protein